MQTLSLKLFQNSELLFIILCSIALGGLWTLLFRYLPDRRSEASHVPQSNYDFITPSLPKQRLVKKDWYWMGLLTILYAIVSLTQLGSHSFPHTTWQVSNKDQSFIIELEGDTSVDAIYTIYGEGDNNSLENGYRLGYHNLLIEGSNDLTNWMEVTALENGSIYQYDIYHADLEYRYYRISASDWGTTLTEIGFKKSGVDEFIEISIYEDAYSDTAYPASLVIDEQDQIAFVPTYMDESYFDEVYHPRNAWEISTGTRMYAHVHPLLGTSLMALSIKIFGMNPFGWRFAGAFTGILMVPVFYLLAHLLFRRTKWATIATFFFVTDFMHLTTSRIGTLEPFSVFFILLMFYYMTKFYQYSFYDTPMKKLLGILCIDGIMMGLGIATKWTACYSAVGLAVILFSNLGQRYIEYTRAKAYLAEHPDEDHPELTHITKSFSKNFWTIIAWCFVFFIFIPIIIYFGSYLWTPVWKDGWSIQNVINQITYMYNYHAGLTATHPYQSTWYMWILDIRPIWYYSGTHFEVMQHTISCFSNPATCLAGFIAMIAMIYYFCFKKAEHNAFIILVGYLSALLPWVLVTRCVFAYHFYPTSVFMLLGVTWFFKQIKITKKALITFCVATGLLFIIFLPITAGFGTTLDYIHLLEWLPTWYFG